MSLFVWVLIMNFSNQRGVIVGEYPTKGACDYVGQHDAGGSPFVGYYCIRKPLKSQPTAER